MTIEEALSKEDMDDIIDSMTVYVYDHVKLYGIKNLEGKAPEDFVAEVLMKIVANDRDWSKATCSFKEFLFGSLKSHLYNYNQGFNRRKRRFVDNLPEIADSVSDENIDELKASAIQMLREEGADDDEVNVFECWIEGIIKPIDIAKQINTDPKTVYKITKRLLRKMPAIRSQFISLYD